MRRFVPLALVALMAPMTGCSSADPASSRLTPGTMMMAYHKEYDSLALLDEKGSVVIPVGVRLRVVRDDSTVQPELRKTLVFVTEGPTQGRTVEVFRSDLRPIPD